MTVYKTANAYYFRSILKIGGIESHLYYIAQKYGQYDITVFFREGDITQLNRLRKYVRCVKIKPEDKVICDNLFCCFNREILDQCEAGTKYLVLHGDYLDMNRRGQISGINLPMDDRIDRYVGVSQLVCDNWETLTGIHADFIGEPVVLPKTKPLLLLSATRLSAEKGWGRMKILVDEMDKAGIDYKWFVFTNSPQYCTNPRIQFMDSCLDITTLMPGFDAYVQLSDNEGFCLSVVEALMQGVPCIVTDCPVFHEIGLDESNSVIIKHDMTDLPMDRIRNLKRLKKFKYRQPVDRWGEFLNHEESTYTPKIVTVKATMNWVMLKLIDTEFNRIHTPDEVWTVTDERYHEFLDMEEITGKKLIEVVDGYQRKEE